MDYIMDFSLSEEVFRPPSFFRRAVRKTICRVHDSIRFLYLAKTGDYRQSVRTASFIRKTDRLFPVLLSFLPVFFCFPFAQCRFLCYIEITTRVLSGRDRAGQLAIGDDCTSTLQELVRYCSEEQHLGALLLTGEWGCGKTHLIEKELSEALKSTHFIVRVSLLGVDSVSALNNAVKKQWLYTCTPFLGKLDQKGERIKNGGLLTVIKNILMSLNPVSGGIASAIVSVDPMEYIPLEPVVEDYHEKGIQKRVVLVFDDLSRSKLDLNIVIGTINEYCENKGFPTIVIGEEEFVKAMASIDPVAYRMIKEKTIARTVRYVPEYQEIIHSIVTKAKWPNPEYADFLAENEQIIHAVFVADPPAREGESGKYRNFRSLTCALQEFSRLYDTMTEHQIPNIAQLLYSFTAYILISRNGVNKNGQPSFEVKDEEIKKLYPDYKPEMLPVSIRQWIDNGIWEEEAIIRQVSDLNEES